MERKNQKRLTALLLALVLLMPAATARDNEQTDSLVRFVKGASIQLIEKAGQTYRKAIDATFLHNGTYLICDTALWNVNNKIINASGHVRIIQDETVLSSEKLDYLIDENLAQFRGTLVQLQDKQNNTLRTRFLDYNTKDSLAVFKNGGALRDKDGQIIESTEGTYDSKGKRFSFKRNVNMYTDSVFVKTSELDYETDASRAIFKTYIDFWKDGNMMSASKGWYDRPSETFFFEGKVHAMTRDQETWSDTLYYYRNVNNVRLLGNAQVQDTTRNVAALADYIFYVDSLSRVTLSRNAAVAVRTEEENKVDTLYFGADTLIYYTVKKCDIPETAMKEAATRVEEMYVDPVSEYRQKAAQEAADAANEEKKAAQARRGLQQKAAENAPVATAPEEVPEGAPEQENGEAGDEGGENGGESDSPDDPDGLTAPADTLAVPKDTTKIGFLEAIHNIRIFRKDIQVRADSMRYNDLDSIARFYRDPVVWNDGNRQYSSDSLFVLVKNNGADRASLMSNAFIITQEDTLCFDQIKATEVMAYFDTTAALKRFDALGGASAFFYLQENDTFATMNKVESKMLSAVFEKGEIDRVYYFDSPKNDAYPVAQLTAEDKVMRGFNWQIDKRPSSPEDVTPLVLKPSERKRYSLRPRAVFRQTDIYFPGYISSVYRGLETRDSLKRVQRIEEKRLEEAARAEEALAEAVQEAAVEEEQAEATESEAAADTSGPEEVELPHIEIFPLSDTLRVIIFKMGVSADSLSNMLNRREVTLDSLRTVYRVSDAELLEAHKVAEREAKAAAAEAKRQARIDAREAHWAELDARDAAKAKAKAEKALARKRARTRKALILQQKQEARDAAKLERYKKRYAAKKAREEGASGQDQAGGVTLGETLVEENVEEQLNDNGKTD